MSAEQDAVHLLTQAERLAALQETLSARFARELAKVVGDLERQIRIWVQARTQTGDISAARAAVYRRELLLLIREAGFGRLLDDASIAATDRLIERLSGRDAVGVGRLVASDLARIEALRTNFLTAVLYQDEELVAPMLRALLYSVYGGARRRDLIDDLADALDRQVAEIRTLYDTALSTYTRQVQALKQDQGPDALFLYAGPVDTRMRPFCRARVGKVFTRADINAMDNGQLPNAYLTGGGYNCRHTWMAVPQESALADLATSGQRLERVAQDLRDVPAGGKVAA